MFKGYFVKLEFVENVSLMDKILKLQFMKEPEVIKFGEMVLAESEDEAKSYLLAQPYVSVYTSEEYTLQSISCREMSEYETINYPA